MAGHGDAPNRLPLLLHAYVTYQRRPQHNGGEYLAHFCGLWEGAHRFGGRSSIFLIAGRVGRGFSPETTLSVPDLTTTSWATFEGSCRSSSTLCTADHPPDRPTTLRFSRLSLHHRRSAAGQCTSPDGGLGTSRLHPGSSGPRL